jgi:hypothetical protein
MAMTTETTAREEGCNFKKRQYYLGRPALGHTQPPIQWVPGLLPRVKAAKPWYEPYNRI